MPPKKPVEALKQCCIQVIMKNIDTYPLQEIHSLPLTLLEELIHFPNDHNQQLVSINKSVNLPISRKIQMITENLTRLSLSFTGLDRVDIEYVLNTIPKQFKNLKRFICEDRGELRQREILNLVHSFPNIIDLTLKCDNVNEDILEAIGDNCPNLERLISPDCDVTDDGVSRLCQSKSRGSNIKYLDLGNVTVKGYLMVLQNLKQLRHFNEWDPSVITAFKKLFQDWNWSHELPTFQLCNLRKIYMERSPRGFLNFLTKCCPNISNLSIDISNNLSNDVIELKKCDKIVPLMIDVWDKEYSMSHLTDVGSNVTSLELWYVNIDLELMGYTCPNLKQLHLYDVTYQPIVNLKRKNCVKPFKKLQNLDIHCWIIDVPQLKFLFQSCLELEELRIDEFVITDPNVFISILHEVNPLTHLARFRIDCPIRVSQPIVLQLLKMENNLQFVTIKSCTDDRGEIESYVKENNLCTNVEFRF